MFPWPAKASSDRDPTDDFWYEKIGPEATSGVTVTAETAIGLSVLYSCVKLIAETAGQLPLQVFRRNDNGDKEAQPRHPLYDVLHDQANDEHTAVEFREMLTAWAVLRGTGMAEIIPGRRGSVDQLIPLHPDYIRCVKVVDLAGRVQWQVEYSEPGVQKRRLLRDELFILRAMSTDANCPLLGLDPVTVQKNTIGAAIAAQDYGNRFFANDARPSGIIEHPSYFKDDASRTIFQRAWQAAFGGSNRHKTAVLEHGAKYHQVSVTPEQAQFLETRQFNAVDVARIYRVPAHKVGILDRATFSNIEQQALEFVQDTMMPWLVRWEQSIKRDLIVAPVYYAEHNVDGLLRGDLKSRYESYAIGRNWGWLSVNDILRKENLNGVGPTGDIYLQPLNMVEAGKTQEPAPLAPPAAPVEDDDPPPRLNGKTNGVHYNA